MLPDQPLVPEHRNPGDRVHILRVQEAQEFRQVTNVKVVAAEQRVLERYVHGAVAVLNVKHHRISADLAPAPDNP